MGIAPSPRLRATSSPCNPRGGFRRDDETIFLFAFQLPVLVGLVCKDRVAERGRCISLRYDEYFIAAVVHACGTLWALAGEGLKSDENENRRKQDRIAELIILDS